MHLPIGELLHLLVSAYCFLSLSKKKGNFFFHAKTKMPNAYKPTLKMPMEKMPTEKIPAEKMPIEKLPAANTPMA